MSIPNYNLRRLLNEEVDSAAAPGRASLGIRLLNEEVYSASFALFGSWFQSIAPLNLKLLFRNSLFGLGSVRSVSVSRRWLDIPSHGGVQLRPGIKYPVDS